MATATATAVTIERFPIERRHTVAVPARTKRRYSTPSEWIASFSRSSKRRAASSAVLEDVDKTTEAKHTDEAVDELAPLERSETWSRRMSKRMSVVAWSPEWNMGALPSVQEGVTSTWQSIRRLSRTEPSHESNFPPSDEFPETGGLKVDMPIYGTIDALDNDSMRLLIHRGVRVAAVPDEEKGKQRAEKPYELPCSKLKNGDWLCAPATGPYANDKSMAMVLRGSIQGFEVKCRIVGMFPIHSFGDTPPDTYQLQVVIY